MIAKLEPEFMPMVKVINDFKENVAQADSQLVVISVERNGGLMAQSVAAASLPKIK